MIKEYRKVTNIKAEQFDNSKAMAIKYHLYHNEDTMFTDEAALKTIEGIMHVKPGDWIATGINGEHWAIRDDIFKKTYEETIPKGIIYYYNRQKKLSKYLFSQGIMDCDELASDILEVLNEGK